MARLSSGLFYLVAFENSSSRIFKQADLKSAFNCVYASSLMPSGGLDGRIGMLAQCPLPEAKKLNISEDEPLTREHETGYTLPRAVT